MTWFVNAYSLVLPSTDELGVCFDGDECPYEHGQDRVKVEDPNIVRSLHRTAESMAQATGHLGVARTFERERLIDMVLGPTRLPVSSLVDGYDPERSSFPRPAADALFPPLPTLPGQIWPEGQPMFPPYLPALHQLPLGMPPPPYLVPPNTSTIGGGGITGGGIGGGGGPGSGPGGPGGRGRGGPRIDSRGRGSQGVGIELTGPNRRFREGDRAHHDAGPPRPKHDPSNTTLMITSIPKELNSISQLNSHFSQFGTIVNIQVCARVCAIYVGALLMRD